MNYIVFDLEWNQNPDGRRHENARLQFEIIEIGAVKLNEKKEILDSFHRLIKPQVYNWIHDSIHQVIHVDYKDLADGTPFPQAAQEFLEWCGEDYSFCTWGNQDVLELQRNLKYYHMLELLPGPVKYFNVQKLFAIRYEENRERRALEYAIDQLSIKKKMGFHRALADAWYTASILQRIEEDWIGPNFSLDVYQNPKSGKEEIFIYGQGSSRYVSREFPDRDRAMKDREVTSTKCPVCRRPAKRRVRWFMNNSKVYQCVSQCKEHGYITGKIRIRKTEENRCYAEKKLKLAGTAEAEEIRRKRDFLRSKKQIKKKA